MKKLIAISFIFLTFISCSTREETCYFDVTISTRIETRQNNKSNFTDWKILKVETVNECNIDTSTIETPSDWTFHGFGVQSRTWTKRSVRLN